MLGLRRRRYTIHGLNARKNLNSNNFWKYTMLRQIKLDTPQSKWVYYPPWRQWKSAELGFREWLGWKMYFLCTRRVCVFLWRKVLELNEFFWVIPASNSDLIMVLCIDTVANHLRNDVLGKMLGHFIQWCDCGSLVIIFLICTLSSCSLRKTFWENSLRACILRTFHSACEGYWVVSPT